MIKCKLHPFEHGEGICASCLHDRLLVLQAAAQNVTSPELHRPPLPDLSSYVKDYVIANVSNDLDHQGCTSFAKFSSLFHHHHRHRSDESEPSDSSSRFSSIIHGRRKKSPTAIRKVKSIGVLDRGMSREDTLEDVSENDYSTKSSAKWQREAMPRRAPAESQRRDGGVFSVFVVCFSPLVRAGPTSRW